MLFTLLLIGLVNSSCINRTFEECLSLNVEYQESCQLSKGECIKRPQNCNEIDATYPLNCRTSECYYSKKFLKCLSQPFTRLLEDDVAYRGFGGHRSGDGEQHRDGHRDSTQNQPQPMPPQPMPSMPPPQEPQQPPTLPPSTNEEQNNDNLDHQEQEKENQNNDGEESEENEDNYEENSDESDESNEEQNNNENPNNNNENPNNNNENPNNNNENPKNNTQINNTSVPTNNSTLEKPGFEGASKLEFLLQQEVKDQMQNSDVKQQIELSSWGIQLIVSLLIIWI